MAVTGRLVPLARPTTSQDEVDEIAAVLQTGQLTQGPKVLEFEAVVAARVGSKHAIATTSATTALHLSLAGLGIGPGDEVLVPDFTFPATANVVHQLGARPVLVDINLSTFTMDPADLELKVTPATRAVIPVHAFGVAADADRILEVTRRHGLLVVEDAACALGTTYGDQLAGNLGECGCFSFHPRKSITTGEGGMIVTDDDELADRLRLLRSHGGRRGGGRYAFEAFGFNYRLSDILAAVGVAQMRKLDWSLDRRRQIAARYRELLGAEERVTLPVEPAWGGHAYQSFVVLLDRNVDRDRIIRDLADRGIETTIGTYALHREPAFARVYGYQVGDMPQSLEAFNRSLAIPMFPAMAEDDIRLVASSLLRCLDVSGDGRD